MSRLNQTTMISVQDTLSLVEKLSDQVRSRTTGETPGDIIRDMKSSSIPRSKRTFRQYLSSELDATFDTLDRLEAITE